MPVHKLLCASTSVAVVVWLSFSYGWKEGWVKLAGNAYPSFVLITSNLIMSAFLSADALSD